MSSALQVSPITVEQYERFEGHRSLRDELIYGEIVLSPKPKPLHQQVTENIHSLLKVILRGQNYTAKQNTNVRFRSAHSMPAPDIFIVSKEEWDRACQQDDYVSIPPILVVEVLSGANRRKRVESKVDLYLGHGVAEVWLVQPKKQTVERARAGERELIEGDLVLPAPLSGTVDVRNLFVAAD